MAVSCVGFHLGTLHRAAVKEKWAGQTGMESAKQNAAVVPPLTPANHRPAAPLAADPPESLHFRKTKWRVNHCPSSRTSARVWLSRCTCNCAHRQQIKARPVSITGLTASDQPTRPPLPAIGGL